MSLFSAFVISALTLLTALYVAAEFGAVSVRRSRVRQLAEDGHWLAQRLLRYVEKPRALDRYIAACQIGITLSTLILGAYGQAAIPGDLAPHLQRWFGTTEATGMYAAQITTLIALTTFNVFLGELVPKSIALTYPTQTALYTILPMEWSLRVYTPFIGFLNGSGLLLLRLLGIKQTGHRHIHSPEELELLIAESRDGGLLEPDEHRRLQRALRLRLRTAGQLMVARERVQAIDVNAPLTELVDTLSASPYTRLPVYRGTLDQVIGVINTKRLALRRLRGVPLTSIAGMMDPLVTVSESSPGDRLLSLFRERRTHQAIVTDPQGRMLGLVTLEDLLGDLLGSVPDELKAAKALEGDSHG